ncbi:39S ribosomal protein L51, mitochondrial [Pseudoliparis swirei]|uniref:39S ribosomal protein L51, mitochondrial n=1 Tax=Pseudoliparis swirei TaxID=2059687 RepID=UPI0024BE7A8B|nr:39S ribosomal protein L51, mitochondrial [Pseudoliparis swirei]
MSAYGYNVRFVVTVTKNISDTRSQLDVKTGTMSVLGVFLKAGASFCQSAGTLFHTARTISTGTCCRIRMHAIPKLKTVDRWTEKRSMFGVYDNIGILGDFIAHPKDLIVAPCWLKGFRGNEMLRLVRKKKMMGDKMMTMEKHNLEKRIRFLYRRYNRTGKRR